MPWAIKHKTQLSLAFPIRSHLELNKLHLKNPINF
jgi:hypothetical protein